MTPAPQRKSRVPELVLVASAAILVVVALTYTWYDYRFPSWREEVLLPDGRRIVVKQRRDFIEGYGTRKTWLTFSLPEMGGEKTWAEWLYPTMIGVSGGQVYVVGRPRADKQFSMYAYPRYTYVAYIWRADHFERIPFLSVPESLRGRENIRWCFPGGDDSKTATSSTATRGSWCSWQKPSYPADYFPRPQEVDLKVRALEAAFWARLSGNMPSSD